MIWFVNRNDKARIVAAAGLTLQHENIQASPVMVIAATLRASVAAV